MFSLFFSPKNTQKRGSVAGQDCVNQSKEKESGVSLGEVAAAQVRRRMEAERRASPDRQMRSGGTDGGVASVGGEASEKTAKMKPPPSAKQMEGSSGSETTARGR